MKRIIAASIVCLFTQIAHASSDCKDLVYKGKFPLSTKVTPTILCKNGFVIGYSLDQKTPLWVAERIDPTTVAGATIDTRPSFHKDKSIPSDRQSSAADYANSDYDKGHMAPFEDMAYSDASASDSMNHTNIVPQNPTNNRGAWRSVENFARRKAEVNVIYIITGPIYAGPPETIGAGQIRVPSMFFKTIIDPVAGTAQTFILPNKPVQGSDIPKHIFNRKKVMDLTTFNLTPNARLTDVK